MGCPIELYPSRLAKLDELTTSDLQTPSITHRLTFLPIRKQKDIFGVTCRRDIHLHQYGTIESQPRFCIVTRKFNECEAPPSHRFTTDGIEPRDCVHLPTNKSIRFLFSVLLTCNIMLPCFSFFFSWLCPQPQSQLCSRDRCQWLFPQLQILPQRLISLEPKKKIPR